jgi:lipoprotein NlpD
MKTLLVLTALLLTACSSLYDYQPQSYVVQRGDTLYSIAWRLGVDARNLAAWNGLTNPDRIYVGQRLALSAAGRPAGGPPARPAAGNAPPNPAAPAPAAARTAVAVARPVWQWPVQGTVVARFGDRGQLATGISIAGELGQDIQAAAAGRVVYSGSGLPAYGQLVIIAHNETWLSAYGHNQRVLVTQDQEVSRGQKIAEMGPGPGGGPVLHFEIRQNGDPLDPLGVLPGSN